MSSDVQAKHPGPLWKAEKKPKLTRQGVPDLNHKKKTKAKQVIKYYHPMTATDAAWLVCRAEWLESHPPDIDDLYYQCALCPYPVHKDEVTLDHIVTRSRDKKLIFEHSNLQPAHGRCNVERGSMTMEAWNKRRKIKSGPFHS